MRAVQFTAFGEPADVARLVDLPDPPMPGPGEVLVGVRYAPVNVNDLFLIRGKLPAKPKLPAAAGNEGVGVVLHVGLDVTGVAAGDRVILPLYAGSWREKTLVPATGLFPLPSAADLKQLAMARINPLTAALMLSEYVTLAPGSWVVQNAANSGVGRAVIAFAKTRGIRTINLVRRAEAVAEMEAAGGDVVLLDGAEAAAAAAERTKGGEVLLAVDGVGGASTSRLTEFLSPGGTLVGYAAMSGEPTMPADLRPLMMKGVTLQRFYMGMPRFVAKSPALLPELVEMVASGAIHVPVAATYDLGDFAAAMAHAGRGGKVLLAVGT